jgi:5-formyltetrahydrofolate cyclo-ligase
MRKEELRQQIRQMKRQFTPAQLEELSLPVLARLRPLLAEAQTIVAYYSLPDEVCTHQLIDDLVAKGKTVLLPKVLDDETMELCRYTGRQSLREGAFHIMEPMGALFTAFSTIDVALIPGVAFDARGHRLGRGRGYYDRFLRALGGTMGTVPSVSSEANYRGTVPSVPPKLIGLCFDFQKVPEVPVDPYDVPVDLVV